MGHVVRHTITLVFTDHSTLDYPLISLGLDGGFDEAETHFLAAHATDSVHL